MRTWTAPWLVLVAVVCACTAERAAPPPEAAVEGEKAPPAPSTAAAEPPSPPLEVARKTPAAEPPSPPLEARREKPVASPEATPDLTRKPASPPPGSDLAAMIGELSGAAREDTGLAGKTPGDDGGRHRGIGSPGTKGAGRGSSGGGGVGDTIGIGAMGTKGRGGGSGSYGSGSGFAASGSFGGLGLSGSGAGAGGSAEVGGLGLSGTGPGGSGRVASRSSGSRSAAEPLDGAQSELGVLTAGDWDDNANFAVFTRYLAKAMPAAHPFSAAGLATSRVVQVRNEQGLPVRGAEVKLLDGDKVLAKAVTPADGRVLFAPALDGRAEVPKLAVTTPGGDAVTAAISFDPAASHELPVILSGAPHRRAGAMDVALVLDTTGSMQDELSYLQRELGGIVSRVQQAFQPLDLRFALIVYRDIGDSYVVRTLDFSPASKLQERLAEQRADGGGDEPEALEQALAAVNQLSWSPSAAKVTLFVADAPSHPENARRVLREADSARRRGVRIYTVAASGVSDAAELQLRAISQLTLGRYVFLTDDSGVGNSHAEPHIPCYQVQRLAGVLVRTLQAEVTGERPEVPSAEILRSVGNPQQGQCKSRDGLAYRL